MGFSPPTAKLLDQYVFYASGEDETYDYFAKEDTIGGWYIMRIHKTTGVATYVKGLSGIETAWANKATQTYAKYSETF